MADVGLLRRLSLLSPSAFAEGNRLFVEFKGALTENYVLETLKKFKEKYGEKVKLRIRFSLNNLMLNGDVLNIPLFMADYADKLIGLSLQSSSPLII